MNTIHTLNTIFRNWLSNHSPIPLISLNVSRIFYSIGETFHRFFTQKPAPMHSQHLFDQTVTRISDQRRLRIRDIELIAFTKALITKSTFSDTPAAKKAAEELKENFPKFIQGELSQETAAKIREWFQRHSCLFSFITSLNLKDLDLYSVPKEINYLINLERLDLSCNPLGEKNGFDFNELKKLNSLVLTETPLEKQPSVWKPPGNGSLCS